MVNKKAKGTKKCVVKRSITFNDYVNALFNYEKVIRSQFVFRSHNHQVYTKKINKIALTSNNDKRIQTSDKITTYPYGYFDNDDININNNKNNTKSEQIYLEKRLMLLEINQKYLEKSLMLLEILQKQLEKRHMLLLTSLILLKTILKIKKDVYVSVKKLYDDIKKELNLLNDKTYNISNDLCDLKNYIIKFKKESYINKIKIKVVKNKISDINVILHDAKRQFN